MDVGCSANDTVIFARPGHNCLDLILIETQPLHLCYLQRTCLYLNGAANRELAWEAAANREFAETVPLLRIGSSWKDFFRFLVTEAREAEMEESWREPIRSQAMFACGILLSVQDQYQSRTDEQVSDGFTRANISQYISPRLMSAPYQLNVSSGEQ